MCPLGVYNPKAARRLYCTGSNDIFPRWVLQLLRFWKMLFKTSANPKRGQLYRESLCYLLAHILSRPPVKPERWKAADWTARSDKNSRRLSLWRCRRIRASLQRDVRGDGRRGLNGQPATTRKDMLHSHVDWILTVTCLCDGNNLRDSCETNLTVCFIDVSKLEHAFRERSSSFLL